MSCKLGSHTIQHHLLQYQLRSFLDNDLLLPITTLHREAWKLQRRWNTYVQVYKQMHNIRKHRALESIPRSPTSPVEKCMGWTANLGGILMRFRVMKIQKLGIPPCSITRTSSKYRSLCLSGAHAIRLEAALFSPQFLEFQSRCFAFDLLHRWPETFSFSPFFHLALIGQRSFLVMPHLISRSHCTQVRIWLLLPTSLSPKLKMKAWQFRNSATSSTTNATNVTNVMQLNGLQDMKCAIRNATDGAWALRVSRFLAFFWVYVAAAVRIRGLRHIRDFIAIRAFQLMLWLLGTLASYTLRNKFRSW